jgi:hypothetical protein
MVQTNYFECYLVQIVIGKSKRVELHYLHIKLTPLLLAIQIDTSFQSGFMKTESVELLTGEN